MDKNTLGNYGWVVITVIIISIMIALASPFAGALKGNFVGTVNDFTGRMDAALDGIDGGSSEGSEDEEGPQLNEYGFYFGQPYRGVGDFGYGEIIEIEVVFYEDGSANSFGEGISTYQQAGSAAYTVNSIEAFDGVFEISENGTTLEMDGIKFVLEIASKGTVQKEKVYLCNLDSTSIVFHNDGTMTFANESGNTEIYSVEIFDHYYVIHDETEGDIFCGIYPDGTKVTFLFTFTLQ